MTSVRHPSMQRLRRLSRRRQRTDELAYVVEGSTLVEEAVSEGVPLEEIVAEPDADAGLLERAESAGVAIRRVPEGLLARVTDTVTPQPIAAIARFEELELDDALDSLSTTPLVLVLVGVNDPGNAGTLLRTADAVGAELVVFCDGAVDPYNPKCVRSSAGALFRLRVIRAAQSVDALTLLEKHGVRRVGTSADPTAKAYDATDLAGPVAVVLGSETHGLPSELGDHLDEMLQIPMVGRTESLNVAMAGTVMCFEALRQRRNQLDGAGSEGPGFNAA